MGTEAVILFMICSHEKESQKMQDFSCIFCDGFITIRRLHYGRRNRCTGIPGHDPLQSNDWVRRKSDREGCADSGGLLAEGRIFHQGLESRDEASLIP